MAAGAAPPLVAAAADAGSMAGQRSGVDMAWGPGAIYGHFGLDMTGPNGGVVRIDDIVIEDITEAFLRDMMPWISAGKLVDQEKN